jgi:hypothetical protein
MSIDCERSASRGLRRHVGAFGHTQRSKDLGGICLGDEESQADKIARAKRAASDEQIFASNTSSATPG